MIRKFALVAALVFLPFVFPSVGDTYMFVRDGTIRSLQPRDLPSVGIRLDTGDTVLGLHSASKEVQEACGWYKVQPWSGFIGKDQVAGQPSYSFTGGQVVESRAVLDKVVLSPQQRLNALLSAMPGSTDDERASALIQATATAITKRLSTAITITIPAAKDTGLGGRQ